MKTREELAEEFDENALGDVAEQVREFGITATREWIDSRIAEIARGDDPFNPDRDISQYEIARDELEGAKSQEARTFFVTLDSSVQGDEPGVTDPLTAVRNVIRDAAILSYAVTVSEPGKPDKNYYVDADTGTTTEATT